MITPIIINRLQWKAYLIFMITNLLFVPLIYFCYPETAMLSLEEMDEVFGSVGVAAADQARMADISKRLGLDDEDDHEKRDVDSDAKAEV